MGRLWQTLILSQWQPTLAWLPVETVIREQQAAYYNALARSDQATDAAPFVSFMLGALLAAMLEAEKTSIKGTEKSSEKSSEKILGLLRKEPTLSARDLAARLNISPRAIEKQIAALKVQGRLQRIGAAKGGHWLVTPADRV